MECGFHSVAEIRETIERREETLAIEQERREAAGRIFVRRGREPGLDISLDASFDSEFFERVLEPRA